jgi:hypothetical protein
MGSAVTIPLSFAGTTSSYGGRFLAPGVNSDESAIEEESGEGYTLPFAGTLSIVQWTVLSGSIPSELPFDVLVNGEAISLPSFKSYPPNAFLIDNVDISKGDTVSVKVPQFNGAVSVVVSFVFSSYAEK